MEPSPLDPECSAARDDLAALAIGTLAGRERAELLGHLERCARSRPSSRSFRRPRMPWSPSFRPRRHPKGLPPARRR